MNFIDAKKILFICVENAGRSQMAEAFFKKHAHHSFQALSAGTRPNLEINPIVVQAMKEVGIELHGKPKMLTGEILSQSIKIVNMGCMDKESCPKLFVDDLENWNIQDPRGKTLDEVRIIRTQIESKVVKLVDQLRK